MKNILFIIFFISLCGCAGWNLHHISGDVDGNNLSTPVGPANGKVHIDSWTCVGFFGGNCPYNFINMETINASR